MIAIGKILNQNVDGIFSIIICSILDVNPDTIFYSLEVYGS